jgi:hypothetical protein
MLAGPHRACCFRLARRPTWVIRGLGRAFLYLSIHPSIYVSISLSIDRSFQAAARFYSFWAECWSAREAAAVSGRAAVATATVEYGPSEYGPAQHGARGDYAGYTPLDRAGAPVAGCGLDDTLASASAELREHFEVWHRDVQRRMDL